MKTPYYLRYGPSTLLLALLPILYGYAQPTPCECRETEVIKICYLSVDDYCDLAPPFFSCEYAMDGDFMNFGLRAKLENASNFGPNGISDCSVELKRLPPVEGVSTIEDCDCDIVFTGQFPASSFNGEPDGTRTSIPSEVLEAIREWSLLCESNLVITSQGETQTWGYEIQPQNFNPNTPVQGISLSIFDGVFGSLNSFDQGGTFQGVFTTIPSTGGEVLAVDGIGRPTIILDEATNDILLADIGILCSNGAGQITNGGNVINNNDILACNLFALGCLIAEGAVFEAQLFSICPGETVILPSGQEVGAAGLYIDTLLTVNQCDSIIETRVDVEQTDTVLLDEQRCTEDGFTLVVNGKVYDEANPTGEEVLVNQFGCDSVVTIDLSFEAVDTTRLDFTRCEGDTVVVNGLVYQAGSTTVERYPAGSNCDSVVIVTVEADPLPRTDVDSVVVIEQGVPFSFDYELQTDWVVNWSPRSALSCVSCPDPELLSGAYPTQFDLSLLSAAGCQNNYTIIARYICNPYIPNAFSPNDDGRNDRFQVYNVCPIEEFKLDIFNRWGGQVYRSRDISQGWDGFFQGEPAPVDVYTYVVRLIENGEEKYITGELNLIR